MANSSYLKSLGHSYSSIGNNNQAFNLYSQSVPEPNNKEEIFKLAALLSIDAAKFLEEASRLKNSEDSKLRELAQLVKNKLDDILKKLPEEKGASHSKRTLENGGMAPPRLVNQIDVDDFEKRRLIEEMRQLKAGGHTMQQSQVRHKKPLTIADFTEPFKYLESNDYNGPFLVSVLKSEFEINNQANVLQIDLSAEIQKCIDGCFVMLSMYDISGSPSKGEEKKFIVVLYFNQFYGELVFDHIIFMNRKKAILSERQKNEIEKFCEFKKIKKSN